MSITNNSNKLFILNLLTAALAACGGGGSSTSTTSSSGSNNSSSSGSSNNSSSGNSSSTGSSNNSSSSSNTNTTVNHALFVSFTPANSTCALLCDTINAYSINNSTGALQFTAASDSSTAPYEVDVTPSGKFAYAAGVNGTSHVIYQYTYGASGSLTPLATPMVYTTSNNLKVAFDLSGAFAIVPTNGAASSLVTYKIDSTTGALQTAQTLLTQDQTSDHITDVVTNPVSGIIYAAIYNATSSTTTINAYSLNTSTDALTQVSSTSVAGYVETIKIDPTGKYLYVPTTNNNQGGVAEYNIGTNGSLTPMSTAFISQPSFTGGNIAIDSSGQYAYLPINPTSGSGAIAQYTIGTNGVLTPMSVTSVPVNESVSSVNAVGNYVYAVSHTSIHGYSIGSTGLLSSLSATTYSTNSITLQAVTVY